jgi:hypothetical protein
VLQVVPWLSSEICFTGRDIVLWNRNVQKRDNHPNEPSAEELACDIITKMRNNLREEEV